MIPSDKAQAIPDTPRAWLVFHETDTPYEEGMGDAHWYTIAICGVYSIKEAAEEHAADLHRAVQEGASSSRSDKKTTIFVREVLVSGLYGRKAAATRREHRRYSIEHLLGLQFGGPNIRQLDGAACDTRKGAAGAVQVLKRKGKAAALSVSGVLERKHEGHGSALASRKRTGPKVLTSGPEAAQPPKERAGRGSSICEHNRRKYRCKECGGSAICEHNKHKTVCKECKGSSICEHNRQRSSCKECGGASICEHNRRKARCKECGGSAICEHNRHRAVCKECGGSALCVHNRQKNRCKECGGASICEHNRVRSQCKDCKGASLCQHKRQKNRCKECVAQAALRIGVEQRIAKGQMNGTSNAMQVAASESTMGGAMAGAGKGVGAGEADCPPAEHRSASTTGEGTDAKSAGEHPSASTTGAGTNASTTGAGTNASTTGAGTNASTTGEGIQCNGAPVSC